MTPKLALWLLTCNWNHKLLIYCNDISFQYHFAGKNLGYEQLLITEVLILLHKTH